MTHRNCITDPTARRWWRDYQAICRAGNPLGLSFVEYVAQRVVETGRVSLYTATADVPWYVAACGHKHEWGESCGQLTVTQ